MRFLWLPSNHGKKLRAGLSNSLVVTDDSTAAVDKIDPLGAIHRASPAKANEEVGIEFPGPLYTLPDMGGGRVLLAPIVEFCSGPCSLDRVQCLLGMAGRDDPPVGNQENPAPSKLSGKGANPGETPRPRYNARLALLVK